MWFFDTPKNYPDMLKKIALTMFFVVMILLFVFSQASEDFSSFLLSISMNQKLQVAGIDLYSAFVYIPAIFAVLENMFRLHDRLSDIFLIRYYFDKKIILTKMLNLLNLSDKTNLINKHNRDKMMSSVFYKYAGYNSPVIDQHNIYMALGCWSWFWIVLDTLAVTVIIGTIFLITIFMLINFIILICVVAILLSLLVLLYYFGCKKYAIFEVEDILSDDKRRIELLNYFNENLKG